MRVIDGPEAPVGVVIGAGACTEWAHYREERKFRQDFVLMLSSVEKPH